MPIIVSAPSSGVGIEQVVLDPTSEDASNVALDLSDGTSFKLMEHSYPPPPSEPQYVGSADSEGDVVGGQRYRNREITLKLRVYGTTAADLLTNLGYIQQKVGKVNREGGTLQRTTPAGEVITFDVLDASSDAQFTNRFIHGNKTEVEVKFTARPFGRGAPSTLADHAETTLPYLTFTETGIGGDVPALGRLVVDEDDADDQWFLTWGIQSRNYDSATTADLFYQADALTPRGTAAVAAVGGASGGNAVTEGSLTTSWQSMLSTNIAAVDAPHLTHVGSYKVWARVQNPTANTGAVSLRLEWGVGDGVRSTTNAQVDFAANHSREGQWVLADLGLVTLPAVTQGDQRWEGRIAAKSTVVGDDLSIDCLWLFPVEEGYGEARAIQASPTPNEILARDDFNQSAGALHGKGIAAAGGTAVKVAGTGADQTGVGTVTWATPTNISISNNTRATASLTCSAPGSQTSHFLRATNFAFAIPTGATIDGIVASIERSAVYDPIYPNYTRIDDAHVRIVKGGTGGAVEHAKSGRWPTSDAYQTYGSATDKWGLTWTEADIESSTFGVQIAAILRAEDFPADDPTDADSTARVDSVWLTVYYTDSGGQAWATSGDASDFDVETTGKTAQRTAVSDADINTGRYAVSGTTTYTDVLVGVDAKRSAFVAPSRMGVFARYYDDSNWIFGGLDAASGDTSATRVSVIKRSVGTVTTIAQATIAPLPITTQFVSFWLALDLGGRFFLYAFPAGSSPKRVLAGYDVDLAFAGALGGAGKIGFYDAQTSATASTRNYDNFAAFPPPSTDAVLFASQSAQLSHDSFLRNDSVGTVWMPVSSYQGDYLQIPPAGREARSTRVLVKASRDDPDWGTDRAIDDISAQLTITPRYLQVPY